MNIPELKQILERKITSLQDQKNIAYQAGDLEQYNKIEAELIETQTTLNQI